MIREYTVIIKDGFEPHFKRALRSFDPDAKIIPLNHRLAFKVFAKIRPEDIKFTFVTDVRWVDPYPFKLMDLVDSYKKFNIKNDDLLKIKDSNGNIVDAKLTLDEDAKMIVLDQATYGGASTIGMDNIFIDFYGKYGNVPVVFNNDIPVRGLSYIDNNAGAAASMSYGYSSYNSSSPNFVVFEG